MNELPKIQIENKKIAKKNVKACKNFTLPDILHISSIEVTEKTDQPKKEKFENLEVNNFCLFYICLR